MSFLDQVRPPARLLVSERHFPAQISDPDAVLS